MVLPRNREGNSEVLFRVLCLKLRFTMTSTTESLRRKSPQQMSKKRTTVLIASIRKQARILRYPAFRHVHPPSCNTLTKNKSTTVVPTYCEMIESPADPSTSINSQSTPSSYARRLLYNICFVTFFLFLIESNDFGRKRTRTTACRTQRAVGIPP